MSEKDINRWNDVITPRETGKPWVLGSGGSWDLKEVQPIPDEMLAELAQRYHYAGTPWNCRSMPLTPSDREYMFLIYSSMQGLVARLRIAEKKVAESLAAPAIANGAADGSSNIDCCKALKGANEQIAELRSAIAASTQQAAPNALLVAALQGLYDLVAEEIADGEYTEQAIKARAALASVPTAP